MWDDSLGAGLQMALFDAVAKANEVPIHRLLGHKVHDTTPLSWWNIDTSAEDMAAECREAYRQGYMAYKTKGRPWFDVYEQLEKATKVVPESFKIDMDFNDTLLDAERAIPILKDLEKYPQVAIYETPIPQGDVPGNRKIRKATRVAIAMHYGNPPAEVAIKNEVCDGFVIGGGASPLHAAGARCGDGRHAVLAAMGRHGNHGGVLVASGRRVEPCPLAGGQLPSAFHASHARQTHCGERRLCQSAG